MSANDAVTDFIRALNELEIPYMLVGSYSSNLYGKPRSTQDADFVIQGTDVSVSKLRARLGARYRFDPQMSFESVTATMRYVVSIPNSVFKVELFMLSDDAHDQARFSRKQSLTFEGTPTWLPTAEDVVITKLRWSKEGKRTKDTDDVRDVLSIQSGKLDLAYIRHWSDRHGTRELFERLLTEAV